MAEATNVSARQSHLVETRPVVEPTEIDAAYAEVERLERLHRERAEVTHHFGVSLDSRDATMVQRVSEDGVPYSEQHLGL